MFPIVFTRIDVSLVRRIHPCFSANLFELQCSNQVIEDNGRSLYASFHRYLLSMQHELLSIFWERLAFAHIYKNVKLGRELGHDLDQLASLFLQFFQFNDPLKVIFIP